VLLLLLLLLLVVVVVVVVVVVQSAGLFYRPLWTFQLWPPNAPVPTDAFRTPAAEVGTYGRGRRTGNFA
jgi:hypothetical protein